MTEEKLTYASVSISILRDMLTDYTQEIIIKSLLKEKLTEQRYGTEKKPKFIDSRNEHTPQEASQPHGRKNGHTASDSRAGTPQPPDLQREPDIGRFRFDLNGKDVYQNALAQNGALMRDQGQHFSASNGNDTYFRCSNCGREIAGSRFAAHLEKCLGGRSRKI